MWPYNVVEVTTTLNVTSTYLLPQIYISNTDIYPNFKPIYTDSYRSSPSDCTWAVLNPHVWNWTQSLTLSRPESWESWVFTLLHSNFYLRVWLILLLHISLFSVPPGAFVTKLSHSCLEHSDGVPLVFLHSLLRLMIHHTPPTTWLVCSSWHTMSLCLSPV